MAGAIATAKSVHWGTPEWLIEDHVRPCFGGEIGLDPCSNPYSVVRAKREFWLPGEHIGIEIPDRVELRDGLAIDWCERSVWVNPPFGKGLLRWIQKCATSYATYYGEILAILPASTETAVFQKVIYKTAHGVCYPSHRIKFEPNELTPVNRDQPTKGHAIIYWGQSPWMFRTYFETIGHVDLLGNPS